MGQYRFSVYFHWQIGLLLRLDTDTFYISLPFVEIHIATTKEAHGVRIFNWFSN